MSGEEVVKLDWPYTVLAVLLPPTNTSTRFSPGTETYTDPDAVTVKPAGPAILEAVGGEITRDVKVDCPYKPVAAAFVVVVANFNTRPLLKSETYRAFCESNAIPSGELKPEAETFPP
jgi:hypothetical protein